MFIVNIIRKIALNNVMLFLVFLFIINPVYADWPSDCNEFGIDKIIDTDCNEIEPRTIFFFNGTSASEWIDECNEFGLEKIIKIWQNEISPGDSIACLHILELNLTERQLDILDKEIRWHKMISVIEDNIIDNFSPTLRNCVEFRSDLAVLEGNIVNYDKNRLNVNVPHWGFDLVLKQPCAFDKESKIRGYYDFLQERIIFNENEIAKMKIVLPAIYFEEFLHSSHIDNIHPQTIQTPLQQFKSGIPVDKIQCKEGLELILKSFDGSPVCVSPETKQLLIERGWAKPSRSISKEFSHILDGESKGSFVIHGSVEGARLSEISFDEHLNQLTIELEESQDGQLTITVPRELFKTDLGNDPGFMVIVDKEESTYSENKGNSDSTLSISFPTKTKEIWVIGTYPVSHHTIPDNAVLQVIADAPCAWLTLQELPHSELLKQHDRTGRNALMLEIDDDDIGKAPHLKEMLTAIQNESEFEPYEYDENTWQKRINSTESEQQQIWNWLKETSDSQFGQPSDSSFTTYFIYHGKYYHIIWALC